jgi:GT2 family glycosyltransferase
MLNVGVLFRNNADLIYPFFYFLRHPLRKTELRVVGLDNGSTDGTFDNFIKFKSSQDKLISVEKNLGIAGGRNMLIKTLYREYGYYPRLLLLDSDVFVYHYEAIKKMVELLDKPSEKKPIGCVFGKSFSGEGSKLSEPGISFVLFEKDFFKQVGLFDERFEMFYDDTDLFWRAKEYYNFRVAEAYAIHCWGSTVSRGSETNRRENCIKNDREKIRGKWNNPNIV